MQTRFRDRVPRLIAELDHLEQDGMPSARKVALLYGSIIDAFLCTAENGMKIIPETADEFIESYLEIVRDEAVRIKSRDGGVGE